MYESTSELGRVQYLKGGCNLIKEMKVLQNGSDIRGVALEGVPNENVNLTENAAQRIGNAFAMWLSKRSDKDTNELKVAIGNDSRLSAKSIRGALSRGIATEGATIIDCGLASTPAMFMTTVADGHQYDGAS